MKEASTKQSNHHLPKKNSIISATPPSITIPTTSNDNSHNNHKVSGVSLVSNLSSSSDYDDMNVSSISLLKGDFELDGDSGGDGDSDNHSSGNSSSEDEQTTSKNTGDHHKFELHLPDFEQLMSPTITQQHHQQQQHKSSTSSSLSFSHPNQNDTSISSPTISKAVGTMMMNSSMNHMNSHNGNTPLANISVGTPSVKSQYYHSTASHLDSEGLSVAGESEYVSSEEIRSFTMCFVCVFVLLYSSMYY